jgi:hypothetical protein
MPANGAQEGDPAADCGTREQLRRRLIDAFAAQEDVYRICLFGREAEAKHDRYSDIDMVVYSNDPARTKAWYRADRRIQTGRRGPCRASRGRSWECT